MWEFETGDICDSSGHVIFVEIISSANWTSINTVNLTCNPDHFCTDNADQFFFNLTSSEWIECDNPGGTDSPCELDRTRIKLHPVHCQSMSGSKV